MERTFIPNTIKKCYSSVAKVRPKIFKNGPAWTAKTDGYTSGGLDWRGGVGLARAGSSGRAVRIGDDLTKINFLMKNYVLVHF